MKRCIHTTTSMLVLCSCSSLQSATPRLRVRFCITFSLCKIPICIACFLCLHIETGAHDHVYAVILQRQSTSISSTTLKLVNRADPCPPPTLTASCWAILREQTGTKLVSIKGKDKHTCLLVLVPHIKLYVTNDIPYIIGTAITSTPYSDRQLLGESRQGQILKLHNINNKPYIFGFAIMSSPY